MSASKKTSCPYCRASFSVNEEQLQSADGRVRCGVCLRVFDGHSGEAEFTPPTVPPEDPPNPLMNLSVQPMEWAEIPGPVEPTPTGLKVLLLALLVLMAGQLAFFQWGLGQPQQRALNIVQLVVRAHPEQAQALRMDAILHNASDQPQPYPALFLYLDNRYGERRAQRLFFPAEYLPTRLVETNQLPARTRVQISLALQDPGQGAVNYGLALQSVPTSIN
ncbi:MAG: zinc-ribbon and DUF3426 domain-containing protein [Gammaproteobacteria bacterium]|nr:zinc-ribbon and DUF3426 domain-containing protein [Gammaproteobacteria bacterium]